LSSSIGLAHGRKFFFGPKRKRNEGGRWRERKRLVELYYQQRMQNWRELRWLKPFASQLGTLRPVRITP
jgi:hypothetical protein